MPLLPFLFNSALEILVSAVWQEKKESHTNWKKQEEMKLCYLQVTVYRENPEESA